MRKPKNPEIFISPTVAAFRLIHLAINRLTTLQKGVRVRWELKVSLLYEDDFKPWPGQLAVVDGYKTSSGDPWDEETARAEMQRELDEKEQEDADGKGREDR